MLKIDNDFCERFIKSLPEQQWGVDPNGQPCGVSEHWIGHMVNQRTSSKDEDPSGERFNALLKANAGVLYEYAIKAGQGSGFDQKQINLLFIELIGVFCFNVLQAAHLEAIGKQRVEDTQWESTES